MTYNDSSLFVVDPGLGTFVGYNCQMGHVVDVAVCGDEIYVLRRDAELRKIIRIAQTPDQYTRKVNGVGSSYMWL